MKFFRILPEICARTRCLLSNSTLNIAFGSGSITVAMTSIASSFAIILLNRVVMSSEPQITGHLPEVTEQSAMSSVPPGHLPLP
jgi:hypothetical protein